MSTIEASFSTLVLSIGSSAAIALGIAPEPTTGKTMKDLNMAKLNIDLLVLLENKTKNNLTAEESQLLSKIVADLQLKFIAEKKLGAQ
jgi:hypothetical protein